MMYLLGCFGFVILQGFFTASEISFISSNLLKLRHRQNKGSKSAKRVYEMILKPEKFLATTLVGTNVSVVLSSSLLTFFLMRLGLKASNVWITFIFAPFVVIFAELIPKNIGRFFKEDFSCRVVSIVYFFERLFLPVVNFIDFISRFLVKVFIKKKKHRSLFVTKEEIKLLVKEIERQGGIDKGEKEAIEEVFEFRSDKIKDVCLSIKKVVAFDYTDSRKTILDKIRKNSFTRYPVYKNKEIIGYVNIYDLFYNERKDWQVFIRTIPKVGFNQKLHDIFTRLKSERESIALVIKGRRAYGIITIHDITSEVITSIIK
jgi:magnesium and cobalt exporter, CNNM family